VEAWCHSDNLTDEEREHLFLLHMWALKRLDRGAVSCSRSSEKKKLCCCFPTVCFVRTDVSACAVERPQDSTQQRGEGD
jgi:hypothetical protein